MLFFSTLLLCKVIQSTTVCITEYLVRDLPHLAAEYQDLNSG